MRAQLTSLVRRRKLLTQREAVEFIAGEPIRGSWWGHPEGKRIYATLVDWHDPDVVACKLIEGKETFVHRALWPALARAQCERSLWPKLSPAAQRLAARLAKEDLVVTGKPRLELERALYAIGVSEHDVDGAHRVTLVAFERWLPKPIARQAARLALDDALATLADAGFMLRSAA